MLEALWLGNTKAFVYGMYNNYFIYYTSKAQEMGYCMRDGLSLTEQ